MKDRKVNSIEVIDWLKEKYGDGLNPFFISIKMCQDEEDVWLHMVKRMMTQLGAWTQEEDLSLDFITDIVDIDGELECETTFTSEHSIIQSAIKFFSDKETLLNTTPLLDK